MKKVMQMSAGIGRTISNEDENYTTTSLTLNCATNYILQIRLKILSSDIKFNVLFVNNPSNSSQKKVNFET